LTLNGPAAAKLLAVRFVAQDRGAGPTLWDRITSPSLAGASLDGEPALHRVLAGRGLRSALAAALDDAGPLDPAAGPQSPGSGGLRWGGGKEWEWGLFSAEDRGRFMSLGPYMNAAAFTVTESCPLSRAYRLFRRCVGPGL
jgi:hypothetical protein